jgi:hypothetical protein
MDLLDFYSEEELKGGIAVGGDSGGSSRPKTGTQGNSEPKAKPGASNSKDSSTSSSKATN